MILERTQNLIPRQYGLGELMNMVYSQKVNIHKFKRTFDNSVLNFFDEKIDDLKWEINAKREWQKRKEVTEIQLLIEDNVRNILTETNQINENLNSEMDKKNLKMALNNKYMSILHEYRNALDNLNKQFTLLNSITIMQGAGLSRTYNEQKGDIQNKINYCVNQLHQHVR